MSDFLTSKEAAQRLGITDQAVLKHIREGNLEANRVNNVYQIPADIFEEFLAKRQAGELYTGRGGYRGGSPWANREPDPDSLASQGKVGRLYLPLTQEECGRLADILTGEERVMVLETFARLKKSGREIKEVLKKLDSN